MDECVERFPHALATGAAGWTSGHLLPIRWAIHVVGPNYAAGETNRSLLVSAGIYGWPRDDAITAAVDTLRSTPTSVREAVLVASGRAVYEDVSAYLARW